MTQHTVIVGDSSVKQVSFNNNESFSLISGPCAIESRDIVMHTAETLVKLTEKLGIEFIFKSSFDKANRTSVNGKRGVGVEEGMKILQEVRDTFKVPVLTDIHESSQVKAVAEVVDVLQIPAFLCRQTDLIVACAKSGKTVNIKKGQFLAPENMAQAAAKVTDSGNDKVMLTERGTSFGYNNLVVDMRSFPIMKETGHPVIMDATHSVQMPSAHGDSSSGRREFIEPLAKASAAIGVAGFFMEAHPNPAEAFSDKDTQMPLDQMEAVLTKLKQIDDIVKHGGTYTRCADVA